MKNLEIIDKKILSKEKVDLFCELGTGKVLSGLLKRISRAWPSPPTLINVEDLKTLEKAKKALAGRENI